MNNTAKEIHQIALDHGWYKEGEERPFPELIALIHSEVTEAFESWRAGDESLVYREEAPSKPDGWGIELADVIIRVFDMMHYHGLDIESFVKLKVEYNKGREYRHGNKLA